MLLRYVLVLLLLIFIARAFWGVVDGLVEGLTGRRPTGTTRRRVAMVRDPVCGTFVVPDRAIAIGAGSARIHFCSTACRDQYLAGRRPGNDAPVEGRTA